MTKSEAKTIIEMCADVMPVTSAQNNEPTVYVNRDYVLKILDMIDENKIEVTPSYPTNIPGVSYPKYPWEPQVWYRDKETPHVPTDIYGNPVPYCNTTGQNPEQPIHTFAGSGYGSAGCSCVDKSKPTHKYEENVKTSSDCKV